MLTIPAKKRTDAAGTLTLEVSTGMPNADVDVLVMVEAARPGGEGARVETWPPEYFSLFGSLRDVGLERPRQGEFQDRLPLE